MCATRAEATIAYLAYFKALDRKPAPVIRGLNSNQRLATDVHAPPQFRAQTVRNLDAWYPAFKVKPGEKLYLAPKDRVKIW